jgi:hypothetical protein
MGTSTHNSLVDSKYIVTGVSTSGNVTKGMLEACVGRKILFHGRSLDVRRRCRAELIDYV